DDRPLVIVPEELPAVPAERAAHPAMLFDCAQCPDELAFILIVKTGVAAETLPLQYIASGIGDDGPAECPGFESHHGKALEVRRHDEEIGGGHRVELVGIVKESEVADARMVRNRQKRIADEDQRQASFRMPCIGFEEREQLFAALVLV